MFNNIGGKIKGLAVFICWMGIVISFIWAAYLMFSGVRFGNLNIILQGVFVMIVGCILSWIGSFLLYGFGELIDRATSIDECLQNILYNI